LSKTGLANKPDGCWSRVVIEKPFGHDLSSAEDLNHLVNSVFPESSVFRIDHYLGKETVQNMLALRFANQMFEPIWNAHYVDHVQITMAEDIGLGGRGGYYDGVGAARDVIQNHLIQLLALTAMEEPVSFLPAELQAEKVKVLSATRLAEPLAETSSRGQYGPGWQGGQKVVGLLDEEGFSKTSTTETFAAITLDVDTRRWAGVPFYLRTGKKMAQGARIISIAFKEAPRTMFPANSGVGSAGPDHLTFDLADSSKVSLSFYGKRPGPGMKLDKLSMQFSTQETERAGDVLEAYERLILDAMRGDHTLFTTAEGIESLWERSAPLLEDPPPVKPYAPGTWGPNAIHQLIAPHAWRLPFERVWREKK
jgi:glucose-6-phosphate 1-dehydrogenase